MRICTKKVRKNYVRDVERLFGVLQARFKILETMTTDGRKSK